MGDVPGLFEEREKINASIREKITERNAERDEFRKLEREFNAYLSQESALLDDRVPEMSHKVKFSLPRPQKEPNTFEFAFNSLEEHLEGRGRFHEFCVETEEVQNQWIDALFASIYRDENEAYAALAAAGDAPRMVPVEEGLGEAELQKIREDGGDAASPVSAKDEHGRSLANQAAAEPRALSFGEWLTYEYVFGPLRPRPL